MIDCKYSQCSVCTDIKPQITNFGTLMCGPTESCFITVRHQDASWYINFRDIGIVCLVSESLLSKC